MRSAISKLKQSEFFKNNFIFFAGSLFVSFLNYLYYPVLGRLLDVESFGEVQVILSLFTQVSVILTALTVITTGIIVNEKNEDIAAKAVSELSRAALIFSIVLLFIITIAAIPLQNALKFSSAIPFILIGIAFIVSIRMSFQNAVLRANKKFGTSSLQGIIGSVGKIIFSAGLIIAGFQTTGAVGGLVVAQFVTLLYVASRARKLGFVSEKFSFKRIDLSIIRPYIKYASLVFGVTLIMTLFYSFDSIIVKYLFSPEVAGQYAGISTIARVVLFLTGSFAVVLLSSVKIDAPVRANIGQLLRSGAVTVAIGGVAALVFTLFPVQVTHLLFGTRYDTLTHILPMLSIAMLFISLSTLLSDYHVALRHFKILWCVGIGIATSVVLLYINHSSVEQVVNGIFFGSATMFALLVTWTIYNAATSLSKEPTQ